MSGLLAPLHIHVLHQNQSEYHVVLVKQKRKRNVVHIFLILFSVCKNGYCKESLTVMLLLWLLLFPCFQVIIGPFWWCVTVCIDLWHFLFLQHMPLTGLVWHVAAPNNWISLLLYEYTWEPPTAEHDTEYRWGRL